MSITEPPSAPRNGLPFVTSEYLDIAASGEMELHDTQAAVFFTAGSDITVTKIEIAVTAGDDRQARVYSGGSAPFGPSFAMTAGNALVVWEGSEAFPPNRVLYVYGQATGTFIATVTYLNPIPIPVVQVLRTYDPDKAPDNGSLIDGVLAIELASTKPRVWVGVPDTINVAQQRLVIGPENYLALEPDGSATLPGALTPGSLTINISNLRIVGDGGTYGDVLATDGDGGVYWKSPLVLPLVLDSIDDLKIPGGDADDLIATDGDGNLRFYRPRGAEVVTGPTAPSDPTDGLLWWNGTRLQVWNATHNRWDFAGGDEPAKVTVHNTAPANPEIGRLWWQPSSQRLRMWDGDDWVGTSSGASVLTGSVEPADPGDGQLWFDGQTLRVWNGSLWVVAGGGAVHLGTTEPQDPIDGALWWNGDRLQVWDGSDWQGTAGGASAETGVNPPADPRDGQFWWNGTVLRVWNGTHWVIPNGAIHVSDTYPPPDPTEGMLWWRREPPPGRLRLYDGSEWIDAGGGGAGGVETGSSAPHDPHEGLLWWNGTVLRIWGGSDWVSVSGEHGLPAFAPTTAAFTVPAVGANVTLHLSQTEWCQVGAAVFAGGMTGRITSVSGTQIIVTRVPGAEVGPPEPVPEPIPIRVGAAIVLLQATNNTTPNFTTATPAPVLVRIGDQVTMTYVGTSRAGTIANTISLVEIPEGYRPSANVATQSGALMGAVNGQTAYTANIQRYTSGTHVAPTAPTVNVAVTGNTTRWSLRHTSNTAMPAGSAVSMNISWRTTDPVPQATA